MVASDRGQLLLLGGLAIAIVFLTAIPLSNSLVVSESASTSETVGDIDGAAQREASVERGIRTLINANDNRRLAALNRSVRNFTRYYTRVTAQQDGVYVNVTLNVTATEGTYADERLRSSPSSNYTRPDPSGPGDANDWDFARDVDEIAIFNLTVTDSDGGSMNAFTVNVTGDSGSTNELRAVSNGSSTTEIEVRGTPVCSGSSVEVDLTEGTCEGVPSFQPITDGLDGPYTVRFENGNRADGNYTFASDGEFPDSSWGATDPAYRTYGIQPAFDVRYVGPDTSYTRTIWLSGDPLSPVARASPADGTLYTGSGNGILQITGNNSATSTINVSSEPKGLGPASDVDSDGTIEVPYVDGSGDLRLVTSDGDETLLVNGSSSNIYQPKTRLAVGTWNGSDPSVFYANDSSAISRVEPGEDPVLVANPGDDANAVVGPADIDDDGDDELVFADGSQTLQYVEDDGSIETLPNGGDGVSLGSSDGIGSGGVADYDGDGEVEVAAVDGGNNIVIADASGENSINSSDVDGGTAPDALQSPPTAADIDDDGVPELMYVSNTDGNITYLDNIEAGYGSDNIEIKKLTDEDGDPIPGDPETGVT